MLTVEGIVIYVNKAHKGNIIMPLRLDIRSRIGGERVELPDSKLLISPGGQATCAFC